MRAALLFMLWCFAVGAYAQVYRWVDARGTVHYSNTKPPQGVQARVIDIETKAGVPAAESQECHTVRCQGERMEERQRRREELEARLAADRLANTPPPARGLEFRKYISIRRGMSEGELLTLAGPSDIVSDHGIAIAAPATVQTAPGTRGAAREGLRLKSWTYLPTAADPFTTTITLVGGRVSELERVRKF